MAADAKHSLVEAAISALADLTPAALLTAVGTREIARRAGVSNATVFYHFGSVEHLADAVVARVYDPGTMALGRALPHFDRVRAGTSPLTDLLGLHRQEFARVSLDPELPLRLGLWAFGTAESRAAFRAYQETLDAAIAGVVRAVYTSWGRELRPPYDVGAFIATHGALLLGAGIRHSLQPAVLTPDLFVRAAASLSLVSQRVAGDRHDLDDRLAEMNYYPSRAPLPGTPTDDRRGRTRAVILSAAAELFAVRGYDETTVARVARSAGLAVSTVHAHFPTRAALASGLFRQQADDLVAARPESDDPPRTRLLAHLAAVAALAGRNRSHAPAYLADLVCHAPGADPLLAHTVALVAAVADDGPMSTDDLGHLVLSTVLSRMLGRPRLDPEALVAEICAVVLP